MSAPTDNASALTRRRAPKPSTPYQNVFRVQFPTSNQTAQSDSHPVKRQSVKRRSHRKSRLGCGNCKRRRVKCDETQPHCERCRKYGITCDFETLGDAPLDSTLETLSLDLIEDTVRRLVGLDQWRHEKLVRLGPDSSRYTNLAYLYHFIVDLSQVMLQHNLRKVMQTDMIKVAFSVRPPGSHM
ncbi:hypothetical protein VTN31DRAFT_1012 [Thermomyces dupontii]|uniref:uncharacterized protein n=1 Tax=Talaromyces thermophilus TaxID=28565 RepID=UPI0037436F7E